MKAIGLTSGGLDSTLAALLLKRQGIEVVQVCFTTPFFSDKNARAMAEKTGIPLRTVDLTRAHLRMLHAPKHGYGKYMNPCIDCHALMIRTAGALLEQEGARFIFTGEVLGQRPMSQTREALDIVARESGFRGLVLRPLSALQLPVTEPEEQGWVDRKRLLGLKGRSRKPQMRLAREFGLDGYPSPAGGCLLTDEGFSRRLRDLFQYRGMDVTVEEIELLKVGRHLRVDEKLKIVVGRNRSENRIIESLAVPDAVRAVVQGIPGPVVLAMGEVEPDRLSLVADVCASYSDARNFERVEVEFRVDGGVRIVPGISRSKAEFAPYLV